MRALRAFVALLLLYGITAAPAFLLPGKVILQHATAESVEVHWEPPDVLDEPYDSRIEPYNHALGLAQDRAEAYPEDLAPPYLLRHPWRLVAPHASARGRELAAAPLRGVSWPDGVRTPFTITPEVRQARNSTAELMAVMELDPGPLADERVFGAGIDPERNLVVLDVNAFDQGLRRRLAREYGSDLVALRWDPFGGPAILLLGR
ncbi:hypothetical protein Ppa06_21870 [Planomonospora parontospora subsp. parontospora]|uniref:Uncharacterized protein n=3 Tax=Planomonospora parontospora TaxID=58119 RepID=A0AA37BFR0_9ACTN|nr:hypothetical protein GCM10010126_26280 [Planomonospora parontospora]GII08389.1 hypothetical protein Ppa06_21870 [Planomonospora parontospora subsp. parontospora]